MDDKTLDEFEDENVLNMNELGDEIAKRVGADSKLTKAIKFGLKVVGVGAVAGAKILAPWDVGAQFAPGQGDAQIGPGIIMAQGGARRMSAQDRAATERNNLKVENFTNLINQLQNSMMMMGVAKILGGVTPVDENNFTTTIEVVQSHQAHIRSATFQTNMLNTSPYELPRNARREGPFPSQRPTTVIGSSETVHLRNDAVRLFDDNHIITRMTFTTTHDGRVMIDLETYNVRNVNGVITHVRNSANSAQFLVHGAVPSNPGLQPVGPGLSR